MAKEDVMIKSQLVVEIADRAGLTRQQAKAALDALIQTVEENLIQGRRVQITGFGTFEVRVRAPRRGVDPRTRQPLAFGVVASAR